MAKGKIGHRFEKGDTWFGYAIIPERKKPVFGIFAENKLTIYGQFKSEKAAEDFMNNLADFFGVKREV